MTTEDKEDRKETIIWIMFTLGFLLGSMFGGFAISPLIDDFTTPTSSNESYNPYWLQIGSYPESGYMSVNPTILYETNYMSSQIYMIKEYSIDLTNWVEMQPSPETGDIIFPEPGLFYLRVKLPTAYGVVYSNVVTYTAY
jgi:hypothetical protein